MPGDASPPSDPLITPRLERALRLCATAHSGHTRKGSDLPYVYHPAAVALILARLGFDESIIAAGLLHDTVEDTSISADDLATEVGLAVADLVALCTETKRDDHGQSRPWQIRKQESLDRLRSAPLAARAVALADKLHNLISILEDLRLGHDVWSRFNAPRDQVFWYFRSALDSCSTPDDPRLVRLASEAASVLAVIEAVSLAPTVHATT